MYIYNIFAQKKALSVVNYLYLCFGHAAKQTDYNHLLNTCMGSHLLQTLGSRI